jgi:hypothetical protein
MSWKQKFSPRHCDQCDAKATVPSGEGWLCEIHTPNSDVEEEPTEADQADIKKTAYGLAKHREMARQKTSDRLQVFVFAGINGEDIGPLTEASGTSPYLEPAACFKVVTSGTRNHPASPLNRLETSSDTRSKCW